MIKGYRFKGKVHFLKNQVIIDRGQKKETFLASEITDIKFKINEYQGEPSRAIPAIFNYTEGIYNYLEIITKKKKWRYELFITKTNIKQLNSLFMILKKELEGNIGIYQEGREVEQLSF